MIQSAAMLLTIMNWTRERNWLMRTCKKILPTGRIVLFDASTNRGPFKKCNPFLPLWWQNPGMDQVGAYSSVTYRCGWDH